MQRTKKKKKQKGMKMRRTNENLVTGSGNRKQSNGRTGKEK